VQYEPKEINAQTGERETSIADYLLAVADLSGQNARQRLDGLDGLALE
jgi:hypothetical protein